MAAGLEQTWTYLDRCAADEGHLVIFDRTAGKPWEEKLFRRAERVHGRIITVWGMCLTGGLIRQGDSRYPDTTV